ncbi:MAG: C-terminal helicase domain-containing protein [Bacteroidota bacterium]
MKLLINTAEKLNEPAINTIGVLSPFRDQVDYLNKQILEQLDIEIIRKYRILCGTAYSFQGEERDVMFISMSVDSGSHPSAFRHLNNPNVFNVSVTRAKHKQYVFTSVNASELKDSIFRDFLSYNWHSASEYLETDIKETFAQSVAESLAKLDIQTKVSYPVAGRKVDFLCQYNQMYFGIDLIGYPGELQSGYSVAELQLLYRSGLKVFPLPYSYWYFDREDCIDEIKAFVEGLS